MHWLPRNMLQHSSISFRRNKISVLNFGDTPPSFLLKSTNKTTFFFDYQASDFSCWLFIVYTKLQQLNFIVVAFFFYWIDKYTLVQTNVNNKKTKTEIIQSQTKNKISSPYSVHVMRDKIQKCKKLQADMYLRKKSHQIAF